MSGVQGLTRRALKLARRGARAARAFIDSPERLAPVVDATIDRVAAVEQPKTPTSHLLLASTGNRNIGDQAMFESFIANVDGAIDVIVTSTSTYEVPEGATGRVRLHALDSLVYGRGRARERDLASFVSLLANAKSFSVVGADIIDGGYQLRAPSLSWALATGSAQAGVDTRILGFSWGSDVSPFIVAGARRAAAAGVKLFARDPDSAIRLVRNGIAGVTEVVDTVFALPGVDRETSEWRRLNAIREEGHEIALLNVSGLIASRVDLSADYLTVVQALTSRDMRVVLVPHVDNGGGSDITACRDFAALCADRGIAVDSLDRLLSPRQIRGLAELARVVLTGRMHLSILAMSIGTPAIVLSTQGKVSGLMRRIGHPEWCLEPTPGFGVAAAQQLDAILDGSDDLGLESLMPALQETARQNFQGLSAADT